MVTNRSPTPALSVVMPVYNEVALVGDVVREWSAELQRLAIDYEFRIYDDGSRDGTADRLREVATELSGLTVLRHDNRGHGPTILRGYREARGEWVFQMDGDGEMDVAGLAELWSRREHYDFLIGRRVGRSSSIGRRCVSWVARVSVGLLFAGGIRDVNSPFRLMRRDWLQGAVARLPEDLFAPNVILSGLAARTGLRIHEIPVRYVIRRQDAGSLVSFGVLRAAGRSLRQTVAVALRTRR